MSVRSLAFGSCLLMLLAGCGEKKADEPAGTEAPVVEKPVVPAKPSLAELGTEDLVEGKGPAAATGDLVALQYEGKLADGTPFDGNLDPEANPLAFIVGRGDVIEGWDKGIVGMKEGGTRKLSIPWKLAYGEKGFPPKIPSKSDLFFEVTLLDLVKSEDAATYDKIVLKAGAGPASREGDFITIHYVGTFVNGKEFDSSHKRGKPFLFRIGYGQVVPGLDAAMTGVKAGGIYDVRIPPDIGFGSAGKGLIPPYTKLLFKVEVLKIEPPK